ncbi:unnamed protein product [Paramecium octaurelia]|uniref:MORN repeat protein n=1 Tax=Paramecium octaurelia TaxID=43137 RepID=A0A8S1RYJ3_PAROT|nr:unnamed protein product [Paramecium octaurelia]
MIGTQAYEFGEYLNNNKIRRWIYIYEKKTIGGGFYDEQNQKNGKWTELSDEFRRVSQVLYNGEYRNGKKVGRWDSFFREEEKENFLEFVGGLYADQMQGESTKNGKWVELNNGFEKFSQITYNGQYKNGKKVGRWTAFYKDHGKVNFEEIGCGCYADQIEGESVKIGQWIVLSDQFDKYSQVTLIGEYQMGKRMVNGIFYIWEKKLVEDHMQLRQKGNP